MELEYTNSNGDTVVEPRRDVDPDLRCWICGTQVPIDPETLECRECGCRPSSNTELRLWIDLL